MKKTLIAITLTILCFGATSANAGLIIGDRPAGNAPCTQSEKDGLIIGDLVEIIYQFTGILVADRPAPCTDTQSRDGLIIGD